MGSLNEGIYWCARDLASFPIGNHHFILIVVPSSQTLLGQPTQSEEVEGNITHFLAVGGFKVGDLLKMKVNEESDVKSVREFIDPEEHTSLLVPDLDLEPHRVPPPNGETEAEFRDRIVMLAANFDNQNPEVEYTLRDENCSAWANTLFKVAGITESDRDELGEFFGIDWGEEDLISESFFN